MSARTQSPGGLFCRHDDVILFAFAEQEVFAEKQIA